MPSFCEVLLLGKIWHCDAHSTSDKGLNYCSYIASDPSGLQIRRGQRDKMEAKVCRHESHSAGVAVCWFFTGLCRETQSEMV